MPTSPTLSALYDSAMRRYDRPGTSTDTPADKSVHEVLLRAVEMINLDGNFFARVALHNGAAVSLHAGKPSWRELTLVTIPDDDLAAAAHAGGETAVAMLLIERLGRAKAEAERAAMVRYLCGKTPAGPSFQ